MLQRVNSFSLPFQLWTIQASLNEFPKDVLITPPMLEKYTERKSALKLTSPYDIVSFNNWDKDALYHERLEVAKTSSSTCVDAESSLWCGNLTDYEIYRVFQKDGIDTSVLQNYNNNPLLNNTTVTLPELDYHEGKSSSNDFILFNIPELEVPICLFMKCTENAMLPSLEKLWNVLTTALQARNEASLEAGQIHYLTFPSSGSIGLGTLNINLIELILNTCYLIYQISQMTKFGTFLYCPDGYTDTSFLLVAYLIFVWDLSLEDVLYKLHLERKRPFFLFNVDLQVLGHLQTLLREYSPKRSQNHENYSSNAIEPLRVSPEMFSSIFLIKLPKSSDFSKLNGPLPSKILEHLYLGSLDHAQSPELLKRLGITHIVSVGEELSWVIKSRSRGISSPAPLKSVANNNRVGSSTLRRATMVANTSPPVPTEPTGSSYEVFTHDGFKVCRINNLQDNGCDPLLNQLNMLLAFIDECYNSGGKVLVHCMVGVSRSATVCIAECMKRLQCDVLKAYLYVRVRRLNVIIQPNLMFMYELLKWQEIQGISKRIDWHILCRSIAELNAKYTT